MLKPAYFLVLFLMFGRSVFSQTGDHIITITPALMPMGTIAVQPGYQFQVSNKFALLTEVAIPVVKKTQGDINEFSCFRVSSELKYYPERAIEGRFLALQLGFTYRKFSDLDSGSYQNVPYSKTAIGYSSTKINSPVFFFNFKLGREIGDWDKLYLDYFIALGLRFIPTRFDGQGEYGIVYLEERRRTCTPLFDWDPAWESNKNYVRPSAAIGLRLGWKL